MWGKEAIAKQKHPHASTYCPLMSVRTALSGPSALQMFAWEQDMPTSSPLFLHGIKDWLPLHVGTYLTIL